MKYTRKLLKTVDAVIEIKTVETRKIHPQLIQTSNLSGMHLLYPFFYKLVAY